MDEIILDGCCMTSKTAAHEYIKNMLDFPAYYGENLDALWDLLISSRKIIYIYLKNEEKLYENLGDYGVLLIEVFQDAANENENIHFIIIHTS